MDHGQPIPPTHPTASGAPFNKVVRMENKNESNFFPGRPGWLHRSLILSLSMNPICKYIVQHTKNELNLNFQVNFKINIVRGERVSNITLRNPISLPEIKISPLNFYPFEYKCCINNLITQFPLIRFELKKKT